MSLSILLDEPNKKIYTACDAVKGRVVLRSSRDEPVGQVAITFLGRTKTKIRKRNGNNQTSTYRGRGTLFWYSRILYQGHYTLRADNYEWPFEFAFPHESRARSVDDSFDRSPPFRANGDAHALPPSFGHHGSGFSINFDCFVEYKLEASLTRPPESYKLFSSGLEAQCQLNFLPRRNTQYPNLGVQASQKSFTAQTLRLLPEKADAKLTMREKMKTAFSKSDLPTAIFAVHFTHPTVLYAGSPFPFRLSVKHISSTIDEKAPMKPIITLNSVSIETKTRIFVRSPGMFSDHHDDDSFRRQLLNYRTSIDIPEFTDGSDTSSWLDVSKLGVNTLSLPADFSTYNISIFTRLDITIEVSCADRKFKIAKESGLMVLPPIYLGQNNAPGYDNRVSIAPIATAGPSGPPAPPPYEHAPEYGEVGESSTASDKNTDVDKMNRQ